MFQAIICDYMSFFIRKHFQIVIVTARYNIKCPRLFNIHACIRRVHDQCKRHFASILSKYMAQKELSVYVLFKAYFWENN